MTQKDLLSRLADAGEEAIQRLASVPGTDQLLGVVTSLRDRMDEMQRRIRGIDALERRVEELERRLDAMGGTGAASTTAQTGAETPPLSTSASLGAAAPVAGTARGPEQPPPSDVGAMEPPLDTGASLGDTSGTAMPEPPAAAGDLGTTDPTAVGSVGPTEPSFSTGPSVGASTQMAGESPETAGEASSETTGTESDRPGSSSSPTGGDSPG